VAVSAEERASLPVSMSGFSTFEAVSVPGSTTDSFMPSGALPESVTALTCTSSTSPTYTGSVPGRL
jgi:hypothetical protein